MTFDKSDSESTFFSLVSQQSISLNKAYVELSDAWKAATGANKIGVATPEHLHQFSSIDELSDDMIPERCVIKFAQGWSAKGVMLLEREPNNRYFDHQTLRSYGLKQLKKKLEHFYQSNFSEFSQDWRIESFVDGVLPGDVSSVSYKFYVFNGVVGLISQVNYNYETPLLSIFNGAFEPLAVDKDYQSNSRDFQVGHHVIPQAPAKYIKAAQQLAMSTGSEFVAVQLFATSEGPVFAGFDFAPRLINKRIVKLHSDVIEALDIKLQGARKRIEASSNDLVFGQPIDASVRLAVMLAAVESSALNTVEDLPTWKYLRLANVAQHGCSKGAWRLSDKYKQLQESAPNKLAKLLSEQWTKSWDDIKQLNAGR